MSEAKIFLGLFDRLILRSKALSFKEHPVMCLMVSWVSQLLTWVFHGSLFFDFVSFLVHGRLSLSLCQRDTFRVEKKRKLFADDARHTHPFWRRDFPNSRVCLWLASLKSVESFRELVCTCRHILVRPGVTHRQVFGCNEERLSGYQKEDKNQKEEEASS